MWGAPGSLNALLAFADQIEPQILTEFINRTIDDLDRSLIVSADFPCKVWRQHLYGSQVCLRGAIHGFVGNAFSIIKSFKYLDSAKLKNR